MIRTRMLVMAVLPIAFALRAEAQWDVDGRRVRGVGVGGQIHVALRCQAGNQVLALTMPAIRGFRGDALDAQWDDGSTERYAFQSLREQREALLGSSESSRIRALIRKLARRSTVRLTVTGGANEVVTDRIDLAGSARAIGSLRCTLADAEITRILIRQSIASYSGSCPCPYSTDRAGRSCGRRSAHSRPGGASPLCYPSDVNDAAVEAYRRRTGT